VDAVLFERGVVARPTGVHAMMEGPVAESERSDLVNSQPVHRPRVFMPDSASRASRHEVGGQLKGLTVGLSQPRALRAGVGFHTCDLERLGAGPCHPVVSRRARPPSLERRTAVVTVTLLWMRRRTDRRAVDFCF
jgi:hypothetical protein